MNAQEILASDLDFSKKIELFLIDDKDPDKIKTWIEQYQGDHEILLKPDKTIGEEDDKKTVKTAKLIANFQRKIVNTAAGLLLGNPPTLALNEDEDDPRFDELVDVWDNNNLDSNNKRIMRTNSVETKVAEVWFGVKKEDDPEVKIKMKIFATSNGNELFPHFDKEGDMDAFTRKYKKTIMHNDKPKEVESVTIWLPEKEINANNIAGTWIFENEEKNIYGKIPVIYYQQEIPDWFDVQSLINRIEVLISGHADTNDYFSSPLIKLKGKVDVMPDKNDRGKMLLIGGDKKSDGTIVWGDAEYLTWDKSPDSLKLELENLRMLIYSLTQTPDISFNNIKGIHGTISGVALKLMFLDSTLKRSDKLEIYGEGFDRRNNLLKTMLSVTAGKGNTGYDDLDVSVQFHSILPENETEIVNNLSTAVGGEPTMTQKTAVQNNPYVENPEDEFDELERTQGDSLNFNEE